MAKTVKIAITGATGFIGRNLTQALLERGDEVAIIVRPESNLDEIDTSKLKIYVVEKDGQGLAEAMKDASPDVVIHLASYFVAQHTTQDINPLIESNVKFGTQLIEAMVTCGIKRLINTGTFWQHYQNESYNPVCLYAATKQAFEDILRFYVEAKKLQVIQLKLFDTYGAKDTRRKLLKFLFDTYYQQNTLSMSPGEQPIDIVHVDDAVQAYIVAVDKIITKNNALMETYAVATGKPLQLKQFVEVVENAVGGKIKISWGGRPYRDREVMQTWKEGIMLPEWKPQIPLEKGIREAWEQYVSIQRNTNNAML